MSNLIYECEQCERMCGSIYECTFTDRQVCGECHTYNFEQAIDKAETGELE